MLAYAAASAVRHAARYQTSVHARYAILSVCREMILFRRLREAATPRAAAGGDDARYACSDNCFCALAHAARLVVVLEYAPTCLMPLARCCAVKYECFKRCARLIEVRVPRFRDVTMITAPSLQRRCRHVTMIAMSSLLDGMNDSTLMARHIDIIISILRRVNEYHAGARWWLFTTASLVGLPKSARRFQSSTRD